MLIDNFRGEAEAFRVESPNVTYTDEAILSKYDYQSTELIREQVGGRPGWLVKPVTSTYEFKTDRRVPKLGYVHECSPNREARR